MSVWVGIVDFLGTVLVGISLYVGVTNLRARWRSQLRWLGVHVFLLGLSYVAFVVGALRDLAAAETFGWQHLIYPLAIILGLIGLWRLRNRRFYP